MKDIFCAKCQQITPHKGSVDANGEFVFNCQNEVDGMPCDRFLKMPADTTPESFAAFLPIHQEANKGQVSLEAQETKLAELLGETKDAAQPQDQAQPDAQNTTE